MKWTLLIAIVTFYGCGPAPGIDWSNYHPEVKQRIDRMEADHDCRGLQHEFDIADNNSDAQRNRTGRGNGDLMAYIDGKLRKSRCYD